MTFAVQCVCSEMESQHGVNTGGNLGHKDKGDKNRAREKT